MKKTEEQAHAPHYSFNSAERCGAKTRRGGCCKAPAVKNKRRCRMHGGAHGSGAPLGNKNALKHGFYSTRFAIRKMLRAIQLAPDS